VPRLVAASFRLNFVVSRRDAIELRFRSRPSLLVKTLATFGIQEDIGAYFQRSAVKCLDANHNRDTVVAHGRDLAAGWRRQNREHRKCESEAQDSRRPRNACPVTWSDVAPELGAYLCGECC
jgi:hypothetical protein